MAKWAKLLLVAPLIVAAYGKDNQAPVSTAPAHPICSVLSKAAEYDGKEVTVSGIYRFEIHGAELFGRECRSREMNVSLSNAPDFRESKEIRKAWRRISSGEPADVVLRGKFVICRSDGNCPGAMLDLYGIQVREYLSVQPAPAKPK
jgi:hypothetical protein